MLRFVISRLLWSVPVVLAVSLLTFALVSLIPGDAARTILGANATPAQYVALRHALGLDQPLYTQYWHWLQGIFHGSLGASSVTGQSVVTALRERVGVSLSLICATTIVTAAVGVSLGIAAAIGRGRLARAVDVLSLMGLAVPNFWLGLVLVALLAVRVRIFPATGYVSLASSPSEWLRSLVLPVVTLSAGAVAIVAKQTRDSLLDVLNRDFVRFLRANGIARRSIIYRHALRNAAISIVTVLGLVFVGLLSGTVLVEVVFALPGLGSLAVDATAAHDVPVILGVALTFTVAVVAVNLCVDLAYAWLNPKLRRS